MNFLVESEDNSRVVGGDNNLGRSLLLSSGIFVVAGKYFYCILSMKKESFAFINFICTIE